MVVEPPAAKSTELLRQLRAAAAVQGSSLRRASRAGWLVNGRSGLVHRPRATENLPMPVSLPVRIASSARAWTRSAAWM